MDKFNPGSEQDKDPKQQPATKGETGSVGAASRDAETMEPQPGGMERMVGDTVSATERVGSGIVGGVTGVATDLVTGVGLVAGEAVTVVRDTANSALAGVGSIGETAVHTVTGLLADLMSGLRDIGSSAVRGRAAAGTEGESRREQAQRREETIH